jgi:dihydrofolate reductase
MRKLVVFETLSLDGYFTDENGDMSWAHADPADAEWNAFVAGNAGSGGALVFGRVTYDMMNAFWPTPMAAAAMPEVAASMNAAGKFVFSRTLAAATWSNTTLLARDPVAEVRRLKAEDGPGLAILGSGSLVAQLAPAGLVDEFQFVYRPVVLGAGRTLFAGPGTRQRLRRTSSRVFANGNVYATYSPEP